MKIKFLLLPLLLCLLLAGCGKEEEVPAQASPPSEPPRCLSFAGAEELEAFFSSTELPEEAFQTYVSEMNYDMNGIHDMEDLAALKERLAAAPFPVVSCGTLANVDIRPDLDQELIWIEYRMENGDSARFRFCYSAQRQDRAWAEFAYIGEDVDHGSHWFSGEVDGYDITYWYFGEEQTALRVIESETVFYPMAEVFWEDAAVGIFMEISHVTADGLTLALSRSGGVPSGVLETGEWYVVQRWEDNRWQDVPEVKREYPVAWIEIAYEVPRTFEIDWTILYGSLPDGIYRIGKKVIDFRGTGDYDELVCYREFEIGPEP